MAANTYKNYNGSGGIRDDWLGDEKLPKNCSPREWFHVSGAIVDNVQPSTVQSSTKLVETPGVRRQKTIKIII